MHGNEALKNKNNKIYLILVTNLCILLNTKILSHSPLTPANSVTFGKTPHRLKSSTIIEYKGFFCMPKIFNQMSTICNRQI